MFEFKENKRIYGLIGYPVQHSYSPYLFENIFKENKIFDAEYLLFPLKNIEDIKDLIFKNENIEGLNVTVPYKQSVIPFLNSLDGIAKNIGAVNTIKIERHNNSIYLKGFNTDFGALLAQLKILFLNSKINKALILGTGGAAVTAAKTLNLFNAKIYFASRNPKVENHISYNDIRESFLSDVDIIINATPVGMYPDIDSCPDIPYNVCNSKTVFFDLVYNPEETLFIKKAKSIGAKTVNGMFMLNLQAFASWQLWNNSKI